MLLRGLKASGLKLQLEGGSMPENPRGKLSAGTESGASRKRTKPNSVRDQKVAIDSGTPGGGLGVPDEKDLEEDLEATAEKGGE